MGYIIANLACLLIGVFMGIIISTLCKTASSNWNNDEADETEGDKLE